MSEERVGIIVEIKGQNEALSSLREIQKAIDYINKTKVTIGDNGSITVLNNMNTGVQNFNKNMKAVQRQSQNTANSLHRTFVRSLSFVRQLGSSFQVIGKTLTQLSSPLRGLFRGTVFSAGYKLLNSVTSGFQAAADRYDTMATYAPIMKSLGAGLSTDDTKATEQLKETYDAMYQSILGLPTGMGEMIDRWKLLTIATQDYNKAAQLAIAENNAIIASGADEGVVTQSKRMLQTLLQTGELTQKQWNSLQKGIPVAWNLIEKEFKEGGKITSDLTSALKSGEISVEQFTDALIRVGTGTEIQGVLNEVMHTFGSATRNISNYSMNMGKTIIESINEVLVKAYGKDLIDFINGFSDVIQDLTVSAQNWIKSNPELITGLVDTLRELDWRGFLKGLSEGLKQTIKDIEDFFALFGGRNAQKFGYFMGRAGYWGKMFSFAGAVLKGFRLPIAGLMTVLSRFGIHKEGGLLGLLGKIFGGENGKNPAKLVRATKTYPTVLNTMRGVVQSLSGLMKLAGTVAIASGTGFIAFKSFKSMVSDLRDIIDILSTVDPGKAAEVLLGMTGFISAFAGLGTAISKAGVGLDILAGEAILGAITTFAAGIMALDMHLILSAATSFKKVLERISESIDIMGSIKSVNVNRSNLHNAIEALAEVYEELRPQYQGTGIQNMTKSQANSMAEILSNMTNVLKSLKEGVDIVADFSTIPDVSTSMDNIGTLVGIYDEVFDLLRPLGSWDNPKQATNMKDTTESLVGIMSSMLDSAAMINKLSQVRLNTTQLPDIISRFAEIRDLLFNQFTMTSGTTIVGGVAVQGGKSYKDQAKELGDISDLVSGIKNTIGYINDLWNILNGEGAITTSAEFKLKWITYANVVRELADWWKSAEISKDTFKGADKFASNLGNFTLAMGSLNDLITTLDEVKQKLGSRDVNIVETLAQFTPLISELNGISAALEGVNAVETESKVTLMNKALEGIKTLITTAEGIDGSAITDANGVLHGLADSLSNMGEELNAIATAWHEGFINALNFGGLSDEMASGLDTILKSLSKYETKFYSEGWKIGNKFRQGVMARVAYINASSTININARLGSVTGIGTLVNSVANSIRSALDNTAINVSPRINAPSRGYMHYGGKVQYRAGGGSIFPTRGSDTVPAMLTPNEFVMRNKAVDMFGLDFMRKVNDLNLTGAMQALQARMNSRFLNGRTQNVSTVNNVYNNQKVTQNVNTNNPNFAFKRSNRYVRALG